ncbi:MAG: hypothetical protein FWG03_09905 [Clostridiales bacterium]|nr:hypothetical protein [Clostridiales bacterium]
MDQYEAELKSALKEGEIVRWKGSVAPYRLFDADNKKSTGIIWLISIGIAAVLSILYTVYVLTAQGATFQPFVYFLTIGFPFLGFIDPVRDQKHIAGQLLAVTNQRVMIFHKSTPNENKSIGLGFGQIDKARIEEIESGINRLRLGSATFKSKGLKLRRDAMLGGKDDDDRVIGLVFYQLKGKDCADICMILKENSVAIEKG